MTKVSTKMAFGVHIYDWIVTIHMQINTNDVIDDAIKSHIQS